MPPDRRPPGDCWPQFGETPSRQPPPAVRPSEPRQQHLAERRQRRCRPERRRQRSGQAPPTLRPARRGVDGGRTDRRRRNRSPERSPRAVPPNAVGAAAGASAAEVPLRQVHSGSVARAGARHTAVGQRCAAAVRPRRPATVGRRGPATAEPNLTSTSDSSARGSSRADGRRQRSARGSWAAFRPGMPRPKPFSGSEPATFGPQVRRPARSAMAASRFLLFQNLLLEAGRSRTNANPSNRPRTRVRRTAFDRMPPGSAADSPAGSIPGDGIAGNAAQRRRRGCSRAAVAQHPGRRNEARQRSQQRTGQRPAEMSPSGISAGDSSTAVGRALCGGGVDVVVGPNATNSTQPDTHRRRRRAGCCRQLLWNYYSLATEAEGSMHTTRVRSG